MLKFKMFLMILLIQRPSIMGRQEDHLGGPPPDIKFVLKINSKIENSA